MYVEIPVEISVNGTGLNSWRDTSILFWGMPVEISERISEGILGSISHTSYERFSTQKSTARIFYSKEYCTNKKKYEK